MTTPSSKEMTAKDRVLAIHPSAQCTWTSRGWRVFYIAENGKVVDIGRTDSGHVPEEEGWADAARRLPAAAAPLREMSEDGRVEQAIRKAKDATRTLRQSESDDPYHCVDCKRPLDFCKCRAYGPADAAKALREPGRDEGERNYHFEDAEVMDALVGTEHLRNNVQQMLNHATTGEKWSLYRAIVKLAAPSESQSLRSQLAVLKAQPDGWIACEDKFPPLETLVDIWLRGTRYTNIQRVNVENEGWFWCNEDGDTLEEAYYDEDCGEDVKFWRPLPTPPVREKEGRE